MYNNNVLFDIYSTLAFIYHWGYEEMSNIPLPLLVKFYKKAVEIYNKVNDPGK